MGCGWRRGGRLVAWLVWWGCGLGWSVPATVPPFVPRGRLALAVTSPAAGGGSWRGVGAVGFVPAALRLGTVTDGGRVPAVGAESELDAQVRVG